MPRASWTVRALQRVGLRLLGAPELVQGRHDARIAETFRSQIRAQIAFQPRPPPCVRFKFRKGPDSDVGCPDMDYRPASRAIKFRGLLAGHGGLRDSGRRAAAIEGRARTDPGPGPVMISSCKSRRYTVGQYPTTGVEKIDNVR